MEFFACVNLRGKVSKHPIMGRIVFSDLGEFFRMLAFKKKIGKRWKCLLQQLKPQVNAYSSGVLLRGKNLKIGSSFGRRRTYENEPLFFSACKNSVENVISYFSSKNFAFGWVLECAHWKYLNPVIIEEYPIG